MIAGGYFAQGGRLLSVHHNRKTSGVFDPELSRHIFRWLVRLLLLCMVKAERSWNSTRAAAASTRRSHAVLLEDFSEVFTYTGNAQTFTVPSGVTAITVELYGASGGDAFTSGYYGPGGGGGMIESTISVTAAEVLHLHIGQIGDLSGTSAYNGGGIGSTIISACLGGSGGGGSDIRRSPYALSNRLTVAGGGGGGTVYNLGARGGDGGYAAGTAGATPNSNTYYGGGGGTAIAGGAKGSTDVSNYDGTFGVGGSSLNLGGGGGGGYFGGGGATLASGGGGSSYTSGTLLSHRTGMNVGNGYAIISWSVGPTAAPTAAPTGPTCAPTIVPSRTPTTSAPSMPTAPPTRAPTAGPTVAPSASPTSQPSLQPSLQPSAQPSQQPSMQPSKQPTGQPSAQPTLQPSKQPSPQPSARPSAQPTHQPSDLPSGQPSLQPTRQPSTQPSVQPTKQPSMQPSSQPSHQPSRQPTQQPTQQPSAQPSAQPTGQPSGLPSAQPSRQPTRQPSSHPSNQPTLQPSRQPTQQPTQQPSIHPSRQPTGQPSAQPTLQPSTQPTSQTSAQPSAQPTRQPTRQPSRQPTQQPTQQPSLQLSRQPTGQPSAQPTLQPSHQPSSHPTAQPSAQPTHQPSSLPSTQPSALPSRQPTGQPSAQPSNRPSNHPSIQPTQQPSARPSAQPTHQPSDLPSGQPSLQPTRQPSTQPSVQPTKQPSMQPSSQPSHQPSRQPTQQPTQQPSAQPSAQPTGQPSGLPSAQPSRQPTQQPSMQPSIQPSRQPTGQPSTMPTAPPSLQPTDHPSARPSSQPTCQPSALPSGQPSATPSVQPTGQPSTHPSIQPTRQPSGQPTQQPTQQQSKLPSRQPTCQPSAKPTVQLSLQPTAQPSARPSSQPTCQPSSQPSNQPSAPPSRQPSTQPSTQPSNQPSRRPSRQPTRQPTEQPSTQPTWQPTDQPSAQPSVQPSLQPSSQPSVQPSVQPTSQPSEQPTKQPSQRPTSQPSFQPSPQPSEKPSTQPSMQPSSQPSVQPFTEPTSQPSRMPTTLPSDQPSSQPSVLPSMQPSVQPTAEPTSQPSRKPTAQPSDQPTENPSSQPSFEPSGQPSSQPSEQPSSQPSVQTTAMPTGHPSRQPTAHPSEQPTSQPSLQPSLLPSIQPSAQPSRKPSQQPSSQPSVQPTSGPTALPSSPPTRQPSGKPTKQPSVQPTSQPSFQPASLPTGQPSSRPSQAPTVVPTARPSKQPSSKPSARPSGLPSACPTIRSGEVLVRAPAPAPNITDLTVITDSRTLIVAKVNVAGGAEAMVYCRAFAASAGALKSVNEIVLFSTPVLTRGKFVTITMRDLMPASSYTVYCTTQSLQFGLMSLPAVLQTARIVETACCRDVTVDLRISNLVERGGAALAITVEVATIDDAPLSVELRFVDAQGSSVNMSTVYPSSISFSNKTSGVLSFSMAVIAGKAASDQRLVAVLSGPASVNYLPVYVGRSSLTVLPAHQPPSVPALQNARFSDDGSMVLVRFNSPTNLAGYGSDFPCAHVLHFAGNVMAFCSWMDPLTAVIYMRYRSDIEFDLLVVESPVILIGGTVRAQCNSANTTWCDTWPTVPEREVTVAAPAAPAAPAVAMAAPAVISGCSALPLDLTASSGSAGRPWTGMTFSVVTTPPSSRDAAALLSYLQNNYTLSPPVPIPNSVLRAGLSYTIQVQLCNFLGACGTATRTVLVSRSLSLRPLTSVLGIEQRTISRSEELVLNGNGFTVSCSGTVSFNNLVRVWVVEDISPNAAGLPGSSLSSVSQNPAAFKLLPYTLRAGAIYRVTLNATSQISGFSALASTVISVRQGAIVANIAGASARSHLRDSAFAVDASGSFDEDYPGVTAAAAGLQFTWSCVQVAPTIIPACLLQWEVSVDVPGRLSAVGGDAAVGSVSRLIVTVSDARRSSNSYTDVTITSIRTSELTIKSGLRNLGNVDTARNLVLYGTLDLVAPCTANWSVDDPGVVLSIVALTRTAVSLSADSRSVPFNLVIAGGKLPQRSTLTFTLSCGDARASLALSTNGAPLPGEFLVLPGTGDELTTEFSFSAVQWIDQDLPLTFQFGFESETSVSTLVIVSKSEFSYYSSSLPAGLSGSQNRLNCTLDVFDAFGASARSTVTVVVRQSVTGTASQQAAVQRLLQSRSGSVNDAKRVLAVATAVMNGVDCSTAPNCTALNRNRCATTSHSCGRCVEGTLGDAGDRNSPCIPHAAIFTPATKTCSADSDCRRWEYCGGAVQRTCIMQSKACLGNCSNHGDCIFTSNSLGSRLSADQCKINNQHCSAACACHDQYSGQLCEISNADLRVRREVRSLLIDSLLNLTSTDDINEESVRSWAASLYFLALRPFELSTADASAVAVIANFTLESARAVGGMVGLQLTGVLQALDTVTSVRRFNYNPNDYNDANFNSSYRFVNNTGAAMIPVIAAFAKLTAQSSVLGLSPSTFFYDNFRLASGLHELPLDGQNVSLQASQTDYERIGGVPVSSIVLTPVQTAAANMSAVTVDLITVFPRAYSSDTSMYDSDPIYVRVQSDAGEAPEVFLRAVQFTFAHYSTAARKYAVVPNVTTVCAGNSSTALVTEVCPGSGKVVAHNCTGFKGLITSTCPHLAPSCARLNVVDASFSPLSHCTLQSYNETTTVCLCDMRQQSITGERRLAVTDEVIDYTGAANVAAISVYVGESFTSTFTAASELTTAAAFARVLIVVYMFATLWGLGLLLFGACGARNDKRLYGLLTKKFTKEKSVAVAPTAAMGKADAGSDAEAGAGSDLKDRLLSYIKEVIPQVYADEKSNSECVLAELCTHHRYMTLFTLGDGQISFNNKMIILLKVLTVDTMLMFLLAVLYDLQCREDDGTCVGLATEAICLERKSILDDSQSFCQWTYDPRGSGYVCSYQETRNSAWTFIYIFVLVSIVTSVVNVPIDYLFGVCVAPTDASLIEQEGKNRILAVANASATSLARNGRRLSAAAQSTLQPMTTRLRSVLKRAKSGRLGKSNIVDSEVSEVLRQRRSSALQVLPRLSIKADSKEKAWNDTAMLVRNVALRKHASMTSNSASYSAEKSEGKRSEEVRDGERTAAWECRDVEAPSMTTADNSLCNDILAQRLLLSGGEISAEFDAQWGIQRSMTNISLHTVDLGAWKSIQAAVAESDEVAECTMAQMLQYTPQHAGLTVVHLFILDLLGRNTTAAKIFNSKFEENYERSSAVSEWNKTVALGTILLCNAFFIYYSLLKAFVRGRAWQHAYLLACVVQMVVEIVLNETIECLWLNYWVPSLVRTDVRNVVQLIKLATEELTCADARAHGVGRVFLDAPPQLFASTKVAKRNAALLESVLVLSYHSYLPGELCKLWPHYQDARRKTRKKSEQYAQADTSRGMKALTWLARNLAVSAGAVVAVLQWSGTLKFDYQRLVIRMVQPILFSGLTMLCYLSTSSFSSFAVFTLCILAVAAVVWWMRRSEDQQATRQWQRVMPDTHLDAELEQELAALTAAAAAIEKAALDKRSSSSSSSSRYPSVLSDLSGEVGASETFVQKKHPASLCQHTALSIRSLSLNSFDFEAEFGGHENAIMPPSSTPAPAYSPDGIEGNGQFAAMNTPTQLAMNTPVHNTGEPELFSDDNFSVSSMSESHDSDL